LRAARAISAAERWRTDLLQTRDAIKATVIGNEDYRVVLRPAGGALEALRVKHKAKRNFMQRIEALR
jgi:hypothetical protein